MMKIYTTEVVYARSADDLEKELNAVVDKWEGHRLDIQYSTCVDESYLYFTALVSVEPRQP